MNHNIEQIQKDIEPLRQEIINHKVYSVITNLDELKVFMQYHVFAVWDFMSLLKTLQNNLTCTSVPWFPKGNAETRYLINEIVTGEEADVDLKGIRKSHFELYLEAMKQCGANTQQMEQFITSLKKEGNFDLAFSESGITKAVADFVGFTFNKISENKDHVLSAVFTFGREDLIPGMFHSIIADIYKNFPDEISIFKYYLERHIEVDGDHHSHLALQMTSQLCGENAQFWEEAKQATIQSLQQRINLWDGIYEQIAATKSIA